MPNPKAADEKPLLPVDALARELATLARGGPAMSARDLAQAISGPTGLQSGRSASTTSLNKLYPMSES